MWERCRGEKFWMEVRWALAINGLTINCIQQLPVVWSFKVTNIHSTVFLLYYIGIVFWCLSMAFCEERDNGYHTSDHEGQQRSVCAIDYHKWKVGMHKSAVQALSIWSSLADQYLVVLLQAQIRPCGIHLMCMWGSCSKVMVLGTNMVAKSAYCLLELFLCRLSKAYNQALQAIKKLHPWGEAQAPAVFHQLMLSIKTALSVFAGIYTYHHSCKSLKIATNQAWCSLSKGGPHSLSWYICHVTGYLYLIFQAPRRTCLGLSHHPFPLIFFSCFNE